MGRKKTPIEQKRAAKHKIYIERVQNQQQQQQKNADFITYAANEICQKCHAKEWQLTYNEFYKHQVKDRRKAVKLSIAAAVLFGFAKLYHVGIHNRKGAIIQVFAKAVKDYDIKYLPKNERRLGDAIKKLLQGGKLYTVIHLPRENNANAVKLKSIFGTETLN